jgi:hypothetical protein
MATRVAIARDEQVGTDGIEQHGWEYGDVAAASIAQALQGHQRSLLVHTGAEVRSEGIVDEDPALAPGQDV